MICLIGSRGLVLSADMFCDYRVIFPVGMTRRQYQDDKTVKVSLTGLLGVVSELSSRLVLVASRFEVGSPESGTGGVGEGEEDASDRDKLQQGSNSAEASVGALSLLNPLLLTGLAHTLEMEISRMGSRSSALALEQDEHDGTNDGNEVEREVHDVSDDSAGSEFGLETSLPRRPTASPPRPTLRSLETSSASPLATRVPSKVSIRLSSTRNVLERVLKIVLLSLRHRRAALTAAKGPLKTVRMAA
jgi:hypothetical protein